VRRAVRRSRRVEQRDERGQSGLEFVLVLPLILLVIFLVAEATSILRTWMLLENASREGARYAAVRKTQQEVVDRTVAVSGDPPILSNSNIQVVNARGKPGDDTQVIINYDYQFKSPLVAFVQFVTKGTIIPDTMHMAAHTHMRLE
jgi:hypothetical protein